MVGHWRAGWSAGQCSAWVKKQLSHLRLRDDAAQLRDLFGNDWAPGPAGGIEYGGGGLQR